MPLGIKTKELWKNPEYRKMMSDAHKGYVMPESQKQKIREASIRNGNVPPSGKGRKYPQSFKDAIRKRMLGTKRSEESIMKANLKRIGKKHTKEHRNKISESLRGREVSIETRLKISKANSGANNFHWKGGITKRHLAIRNSFEYRQWREAIFKRDNWTCRKCKIVGGKLNADHIKSFSKYPSLRFSLSNGRTLCENCHRKTPNFGIKAKYV